MNFLAFAWCRGLKFELFIEDPPAFQWKFARPSNGFHFIFLAPHLVERWRYFQFKIILHYGHLSFVALPFTCAKLYVATEWSAIVVVAIAVVSQSNEVEEAAFNWWEEIHRLMIERRITSWPMQLKRATANRREPPVWQDNQFCLLTSSNRYSPDIDPKSLLARSGFCCWARFHFRLNLKNDSSLIELLHTEIDDLCLFINKLRFLSFFSLSLSLSSLNLFVQRLVVQSI